MWTSVSAVEKAAEMGLRYWALGYIYNDWPERSAHQDDGDDLHSQVEHYYKGVKLDLRSPMGRLAILGKQYWPEPCDMPAVEEVINVEYGPHVYRNNKIDLSHDAPACPMLLDHKTVKSFKWTLNRASLRANRQANVYGYYVMKKYGADYLNLRWIYYLTEGVPDFETFIKLSKAELEALSKKHIKLVEATIDMDDAKAFLNRDSAIIDKMQAIRDERDKVADKLGIPRKDITPEQSALLKKHLPILDIPCNDGKNGRKMSCESFSGCYGAPQCGVTLRDRSKK